MLPPLQGAQASLLQTLQQQNKLRAACMGFTLLAATEDEQAACGEAEQLQKPVAQVSLYRADALTTVLELDKGLAIARADDAAGLIFGLSPRALVKTSITG